MYTPISDVLSDEADNDLHHIFDYTEQEHDFDQAILYLMPFKILFNTLVSNPELEH